VPFRRLDRDLEEEEDEIRPVRPPAGVVACGGQRSVVPSALVREDTDDREPPVRESDNTHEERMGKMDEFVGTFLAFAFVIGVLAVVAWALYEMTFARHTDQFRDPRTGKFQGKSPRLD
jgi:hypothetical protein